MRPGEFARWTWRQLTSMRTALILLFLLAVAAIPGSLIPQDEVDPAAVFAFKADHPQLSPVLDSVGMFDVYSSVWFSAIYVLLMVSLIGCIVPRARVYARSLRARPPKGPRNLARLPAYATWRSDEPVDVVTARVVGRLRGERRRTHVYLSGEVVDISAEKGYAREAGNLLFHIALLVVLVGVAMTGLYGYKGSAAVVSGRGFSNTLTQYDDFSPGARFDPADLSPFNLQVDDFSVTWKRQGAGAGTPLEFTAQLSVTESPGATPYRYDLRVNSPLTVDGTSVFLVGHGYAPIISVRDGNGDLAFSGPVVFLPQDSSFTSFGVIKVPNAGPTQLGFEGYFFPTAALSEQGQPFSSFPDADNPVLSLIAYSGDLGLDTGAPQSVYVLDKDGLQPYTMDNGKPEALLLRDGKSVDLPGGAGSIRFEGYQRWVKLQVAHSPGTVVPLAGVIAAIVGLMGTLFIRPRRTWVRLRDDHGRTVVEIAALDRVSGGEPGTHVADLMATLQSGSVPADARRQAVSDRGAALVQRDGEEESER